MCCGTIVPEWILFIAESQSALVQGSWLYEQVEMYVCTRLGLYVCMHVYSVMLQGCCVGCIHLFSNNGSHSLDKWLQPLSRHLGNNIIMIWACFLEVNDKCATYLRLSSQTNDSRYCKPVTFFKREPDQDSVDWYKTLRLQQSVGLCWLLINSSVTDACFMAAHFRWYWT